MKRLIFVLGMLLVVSTGCEPVAPPPANYKSGDFYRPSMQTIEHDGHKFVWARDGHAGTLLHHPDCNCLKE